MAQLMPLPLTVSCFSKIQIGFTFLVPAHLGSPGKGPLNGYVCTQQLPDSGRVLHYPDLAVYFLKIYGWIEGICRDFCDFQLYITQ